jgi:hypothetical protein
MAIVVEEFVRELGARELHERDATVDDVFFVLIGNWRREWT